MLAESIFIRPDPILYVAGPVIECMKVLLHNSDRALLHWKAGYSRVDRRKLCAQRSELLVYHVLRIVDFLCLKRLGTGQLLRLDRTIDIEAGAPK